MPLASGARFGPYEILSSLGAGGMGEVYRARDPRLGREVAIKVIAGDGPPGPDRVRRFEEEARAVAALGHPGILAVHDVGTHDGQPYVVFELLEGETLRDRLQRGPLPPRKAVELAAQIGQGLAAAHACGFVHRDLKPANLFLNRDGRVKILDFGLAKLVEPDAPGSRDATETGVFAGTPGYAAPEQVRGAVADQRADIFALGAVLYETATGRKAFEGGTAADTLSAVLNREPPPMEGAAGDNREAIPPALERVVRRCLEKEPEERFQSARDVAFALEALAGSTAPFSVAPGAPPTGGRRRVTLGIAAVLLAGAAAIGGYLWGKGRASATAEARGPVRPRSLSVRFAFGVERGGVFSSENAGPSRTPGLVALCPDGSCVVYRGSRDGEGLLFHRPLDRLASTPLPGTRRGHGPIFSPDGRWIAFFADDRLKKVEVDRPGIHVVCPAPRGESGSWSADGSILFAAASGGPIFRVAAAGGEPEPVTRLDRAAGETAHRWPVALPDGRTVLYEAVDGSSHSRIVIETLGGGRRETLVDGGRCPRLDANGHILFVFGNGLRAVPFDWRAGRLAGPPIDGFGPTFGVTTGVGKFDVAGNGTLVWMAILEADRTSHRLWRVERSGQAVPLSGLRGAFSYPRLSPDGRRLAVTLLDQGVSFVAVYDLATRVLTRLTRDGDSGAAVWTPDGRQLTYRSNRGGSWNLYSEPADGSGPVDRLTTSPYEQYPVSWSPDGRTLTLEQADPMTGGALRTLSLNERPTTRPLVDGPNGAWDGFISPDGRLVAYTSIESGRLEVYVRPLHAGAKRQVSTAGGNSPLWSRDGRELFYLQGESMMAVPIANRTGLVVSRPVSLFSGAYDYVGQVPNFDVTPDGRGFVMVRGDEGRDPWMQVNVMLNGFDRLEPPPR